MFTVICIMFGGIAAGYLLRKSVPLRKVGKLISVSIYLLLFLLGITVGSNPDIMDNLTTLGWQAFLIALAGTSGSVLLAGVVY
ncbi:MAG: lysine exporter LysO family protein, partial [Tannerellaceae bacterium]|nr:lysine exporter LysO family protein [Tannerellaceae bacterium]